MLQKAYGNDYNILNAFVHLKYCNHCHKLVEISFVTQNFK